MPVCIVHRASCIAGAALLPCSNRYPTTERLPEDANNDPLKFELENVLVKVTRIRRLSDNNVTLLTRTKLEIAELHQEFTRYQVQTAMVCVSTFNQLKMQQGHSTSDTKTALTGEYIFEVPVNQCILKFPPRICSRTLIGTDGRGLMGHCDGNPPSSVFSRGGSLLPSVCADVRALLMTASNSAGWSPIWMCRYATPWPV